jgi:hypothetical protein
VRIRVCQVHATCTPAHSALSSPWCTLTLTHLEPPRLEHGLNELGIVAATYLVADAQGLLQMRWRSRRGRGCKGTIMHAIGPILQVYIAGCAAVWVHAGRKRGHSMCLERHTWHEVLSIVLAWPSH